MRHPDYVENVLEELRRYFLVTNRKKAWQELKGKTPTIKEENRVAD